MLTKPDIEAFKSSVVGSQYPCSNSKFIIYPANFIFYALWQVVKYVMNETGRNMVKPIVTYAGLQEYIDDKYIPLSMGGECDYIFNSDDYVDSEIYSEEDIKKKCEYDRQKENTN